MKKSKIIAPALGLIALGTAASITGTVAWFSMNTQVKVSGMTFSTKVKDNLLVSEDNSSSASFKTSLTSDLNGILEPASSADGLSYWYAKTNNVDASGAVIEDDEYQSYSEATSYANETANKTNYDANFNTNYGFEPLPSTTTVCYGYLDLVFYIKATNSSGSAQNLQITDLNLKYNNSVITEKAWRIAIFSVDATEGAGDPGTALAAGNRKTILAPSGAKNFSWVADTHESNDAVSAANALTSVTYGTAATLASVAGGATTVQRVTLRLWLEGEDNTCNNSTFASLTADYSLDLEARLAGTAVTAIRSVVATATNDAEVDYKANVALAGDTASTYQWYLVSTGAAIENATSASYTGTNGQQVYCVVKTAEGRSYQSNTVTLAAHA